MSDVEVLNPVSKINIKCAGALEINQFNFSRAHPKSRRRNYLPYSRKCVSGTSVCLRLMVMSSVNLVPVDKTPLDEAGVSYGRHHCLSPLMCRPRPPPPPRLTYHHSHLSAYLARAAEIQSTWPCAAASHYQSLLPTFVFVFSFPPRSLPSHLSLIIFVSLCPRLCLELAVLYFLSPFV